MESDAWRGVETFTTRVEAPSAGQILDQIAALDAEHRTIITLTNSDSSCLTIAGGLDGKFIVVHGDTLGFSHSLIGNGRSEELVEMNVGGQLSEFPSDSIVDLEAAYSAALFFADVGEMNPALKWRED